MERTFGEGHVQCISKLSIVFVNTNGKLYKKLFEILAGEQLSSLLHGDPIDQYLLPTDLNKKGYFVFDPLLTHKSEHAC